MIQLKHISFRFNKQIHVLNGADYVFENGIFYCLASSTEAARTATLSVVCGLIEPENGQLSYNGEKFKVLQKDFLRKIACFQTENSPLFSRLTVEQNIQMAIDISSPERKYERHNMFALFEMFGLSEELARVKAKQLSRMQNFKIDIVKNLLCEREIFLFKEPLRATVENIEEIVKTLKKLAHEMNKCVIYSTDSKDLAKQSDKIVVLKNGKLI